MSTFSNDVRAVLALTFPMAAIALLVILGG